MKAVIIGVLAVLAACTTQPPRPDPLTISNGNYRITPSPVPGATYRLDIVNAPDIGFDRDQPLDRHAKAISLLQGKCEHPYMVQEQMFVAADGSYWPATRLPRRVYVSDWACS